MYIIRFLSPIILFYVFISPNVDSADPRIVGGTLVKNISDFPYQVSLRLITSHICGGALLNPNHVLTAAHCVYNTNTKTYRPANTLSVQVGSLRVNNNSARTEDVLYIFHHEQYNPANQMNDICVLRLKNNITYSQSVQAINLANTPTLSGTCNVSGWGTLYSEGPASLNLRYVEVPIVPWNQCQNKSYPNLYNKSICAGAKGRDSCQGDSGGPLVCRKTLAGVVSYGAGCGEEKYPGVYTDVYKYREWIVRQFNRTGNSQMILKPSLLFVVSVVMLVLHE